LRTTIIARLTAIFAGSEISFVDMAANLGALTDKVTNDVKPYFSGLGLELSQFAIASVSLPEDLQKVMDQRIGVNMAGDLGRLTQFEAAESLEEAAQNTGGTAGMGVGLGAGAAMAQALMGQAMPGQAMPGQAGPGQAHANSDVAAGATVAGSKFCIECGKPMPERAKFCPECGKPQ
jgi:membrane protease subunit (stomatin/prohibitin family)